ncbi:MAG: hypothetical protein KGK03_06750, partial [Candidatus Omnitrophica bacterium]|nr:hypothetical protein [Candidatus Omnitrophota bacterium]
VFGEMPDKILVEVNLLSSKSLIDLEFEEIIDKCFEILKFQGRLPAVKPRSLELERNLEVYDYFKKTASIKKTADKFFKSDDEESSISRTKKVIKRTEQLINKGYMELI